MQYLKAACGFAVLSGAGQQRLVDVALERSPRRLRRHLLSAAGASVPADSGLPAWTPISARDDDHYLASKLKEIGFPTWNDPATAPCHTSMPATKKRVMQYPPGTGFVLALFPQGFQVIPLYVLATVIIFGFALLGISYARSRPAVLLTAAFGCLAIYLMINPAKASYSVAPTMVACALAGFLTAKLFAAKQRRHRLASDGARRSPDRSRRQFQIAEPVSVVRIFAVLLRFIPDVPENRDRPAGRLVRGRIPGRHGADAARECDQCRQSAFATTYGAVDVTPPEFSFGIIWSYLADMQFVLLVLASAWTALDVALASRQRHEAGRACHGWKSCW